MSSVLVELAVAVGAFVGTMIDNYFAFAGQLAISAPERHRGLAWAQATGVAGLVVVAATLAYALTNVPLRAVGLLALAPWLLGLHAWRHRDDTTAEPRRRGQVTTFLTTFALGGDNLAVWAPLLRAAAPARAALSIVAFAVCEVGFVVSARTLAGHPRVVAWGQRQGRRLVPLVYGLLGVAILLECHTL